MSEISKIHTERAERDASGSEEKSRIHNDDNLHEKDVSALAQGNLDEEEEEEDLSKLRKVPDRIPPAVWIISIVSLCERYAYYGIIGILQNYIQNSSHDPLRPGALGLGQSKATLLVNIFLVVSYVTPMFAAVVADNYIGRHRTICLGLSIYIVGATILTVTSIPELLRRGSGLPGLIVAMLIISLALSAVKANLPPFLADQCGRGNVRVEVRKSGERVMIDRDATREYAFNIYYWCVNVGAQSRLAATYIEKDVAFWAAYLMSVCALCVALTLLIGGRRRFGEYTTFDKPADLVVLTEMTVDSEKQPNLLPKTWKAFGIAIRHGFRLDAAKPEQMLQREGKTADWDDGFIKQLQTGLIACRSFVPFIIFVLCQNQMYNNTISQAAEMQTHGVPNDLLVSVNSITVITVMPIMTHGVYPLLRKLKIRSPPITRMAVGFLWESFSIGYAAGVQGWIYASGPCYRRPLNCPASPNGELPNNVNVAVQVPVYILLGLGEIFAYPACYEYAYTKAPKTMKSMVQAVLSLAMAGAAVLGLALTPTSHDPEVLVMYASLAGVMLLTTVLFTVAFWKYNKQEARLNDEVEGEK